MSTTKEELEQLLANLPSGAGLNPGYVIEWAGKHPNSALHAEFEWDNDVAGPLYRLQVARRLIIFHTRKPDGQPSLVSLSILRSNKPDGGYFEKQAIVKLPNLRQAAINDMLADFEVIVKRYEWLQPESSLVIDAIKKTLRKYRLQPKLQPASAAQAS